MGLRGLGSGCRLGLAGVGRLVFRLGLGGGLSRRDIRGTYSSVSKYVLSGGMMGLGGRRCPVLIRITSHTGSGFLGGGGTYTFVPRKRALKIVGPFIDLPRSVELYSASFWRCLDRRRSWLCAIGP